jgi:hypothetical protein
MLQDFHGGAARLLQRVGEDGEPGLVQVATRHFALVISGLGQGANRVSEAGSVNRDRAKGITDDVPQQVRLMCRLCALHGRSVKNEGFLIVLVVWMKGWLRDGRLCPGRSSSSQCSPPTCLFGAVDSIDRVDDLPFAWPTRPKRFPQ